jgi:inner membrane protein
MDSITQATLGAAIGEAFLGKKIGNKGAVLGATVATIPDLDVVFYLFYDKLEMLSIHRGYSHSILLSVLGAFLIAYLLKKAKWTEKLSYQRLWLFSWLALFTHSLLDTFTAYGTQLFLPFSDARLGFDSVNVIDPVYTVPLLLGLIGSLLLYRNKPSRPIYNYVGLMVSSFYLVFTLVIKQQVEKHFVTTLESQNISYKSLLTMPVGMASLKWYGVAKTEDGIYISPYVLREQHPLNFTYFPINDYLLERINPMLSKTLKWFAKDFYTVTERKGEIHFYNLQVDMRGIIKNDSINAPTAGYFIIKSATDGGFQFSSGTHQE